MENNTINEKGEEEKDRETYSNTSKDIQLGLEEGMQKLCQKLASDGKEKRKLERLLLSPSKTHSAPVSPNIEVLDLTWDEETERSVKRTRFELGQKELKKDELMREGKLATLVRKVVKQIDVQARCLSKCTKAHNNTKKEVKEMASNIRSLSSQLMTGEVQQLLQTLGKNPPDFPTHCSRDAERIQKRGIDGTGQPESAASHTPILEDEDDSLLISKARDKVGELRELLREKGDTSPDLESKTSEILNLLEKAERRGVEDKEYKRAQINEVLDSGSTYESFSGILGWVWPDSCYANSNLLNEDPLQGDIDLAWFRFSEVSEELEEIEQRVVKKFPEVMDMKEDGWEALEKLTKRKTVEKEIMGDVSSIHVGAVGEGKEMFTDLNKLKFHLEGLNKTHVVVVNVKRGEIEMVRKMIQCIFHKSGIVVDVYAGERFDQDRRNYNNDAILIKAEGLEYVEALKKVKDGLSKGASDIPIKGIRKTKKGDVLVEIQKGDNNSRIRNICNNLGELQVTVLKQNALPISKYLIRNLDAVATEREVLSAIQETAIGEEDRESVKVVSLKATSNGTQSAVVVMEESWAKRLIQIGGVRIGMVVCEITEWINVNRCYRCWGYDHVARTCTGPDRTKACLKCGGGGHEAARCENALYCPLCQQAGHRAGSGACPKMRLILRKIRDQKSVKRRT